METAFDFIDELKRVIYEKCKLLSYWRTVRHLLLVLTYPFSLAKMANPKKVSQQNPPININRRNVNIATEPTRMISCFQQSQTKTKANRHMYGFIEKKT